MPEVHAALEAVDVPECQYTQCAWRLGIDGVSCPDDCRLNA